MAKRYKPRLSRAGSIAIPSSAAVAAEMRAGYSKAQAYVRAFNETNHLHHTPFESERRGVEQGAA